MVEVNYRVGDIVIRRGARGGPGQACKIVRVLDNGAEVEVTEGARVGTTYVCRRAELLWVAPARIHR